MPTTAKKTYTYKYVKAITVGHKPDGKPIRKYIRENNKAIFEQKVRYYQNLNAKGVQIVGKALTVEQWAWQWYHTYKEPKIGASQRINYEINLKRHILPVIGFMPVTAVRPFHLQQLVNDARREDGKPLAQGTVRQILYTLRQLFEQAEINGLIEVTPCRRIENIATGKTARRALTREEESLVRKVAARHWAGPWVLLMLDCGLRRGETVPIGKADLRKDGTLLRISSSATYAEGNQAKKKSTKTAAGERLVPMPPELLARLDQSGRYFVHGRDGKMLTLTHLRRMWTSFHRACDREAGAKLYRNKIIEHAFDPAITPHFLRHTYCTNLRRQGYDLKTAQYLMGHASITTTANIYSHVDEDDIASLAPSTEQKNA